MLLLVDQAEFFGRSWEIVSWAALGLALNLWLASSLFRIRCLEISGARKIPWHYKLPFPWRYGFLSRAGFPAARGREPFFDFVILPMLVMIFAPVILVGISLLWIIAGIRRARLRRRLADS